MAKGKSNFQQFSTFMKDPRNNRVEAAASPHKTNSTSNLSSEGTNISNSSSVHRTGEGRRISFDDGMKSCDRRRASEDDAAPAVTATTRNSTTSQASSKRSSVFSRTSQDGSKRQQQSAKIKSSGRSSVIKQPDVHPLALWSENESQASHSTVTLDSHWGQDVRLWRQNYGHVRYMWY